MSGWITTLAPLRGHRVRFLYGTNKNGLGTFAGIDATVRTLECECGWEITYSEEHCTRQSAIDEHARHVDAIRKRATSIGERDAAAELELRERRDMLVDLDARPDDDDVRRFDDVPHPADEES